MVELYINLAKSFIISRQKPICCYRNYEQLQKYDLIFVLWYLSIVAY